MIATENKNITGFNCPVPNTGHEQILLSHGSGGSMMHRLLKEIFIAGFDNPLLNEMGDGAVFDINGSRLAFTTDSYVVDPVFFPGGDIGSLAVNGTVNDLAMCGAWPLYISAGFIIEEGFSVAELREVVKSMKEAADAAGVQVVTGDTKVVGRGKGDKVFINTAGIGIVPENVNISPKNIKPGDVIIINGRIAEHGMAIMSKRQGFEFETEIISDCSPLNGLVGAILDSSLNIRMMRDATRGGVASVLNEIAEASNLGIAIDETSIPISGQVRAACEILGFDPLYVANEGKMLVFVSPGDAETVLKAMKNHPMGTESAIIGMVVPDNPGLVVMKTEIGSMRIVDMLSGEQLPRIC